MCAAFAFTVLKVKIWAMFSKKAFKITNMFYSQKYNHIQEKIQFLDYIIKILKLKLNALCS